MCDLARKEDFLRGWRSKLAAEEDEARRATGWGRTSNHGRWFNEEEEDEEEEEGDNDSLLQNHVDERAKSVSRQVQEQGGHDEVEAKDTKPKVIYFGDHYTKKDGGDNAMENGHSPHGGFQDARSDFRLLPSSPQIVSPSHQTDQDTSEVCYKVPFDAKKKVHDPQDERYYVADASRKDGGAHECSDDGDEKKESPVQDSASSPAKRVIDRQKKKQGKQQDVTRRNNNGSHGVLRSLIDLRNADRAPGEMRQETPPRNSRASRAKSGSNGSRGLLLNLFSKSTSALAVFDKDRASGGAFDSPGGLLGVAGSERIGRSGQFSYNDKGKRTNMVRRQEPNKPSLDLWSNALRYKGTLEQQPELGPKKKHNNRWTREKDTKDAFDHLSKSLDYLNAGEEQRKSSGNRARTSKERQHHDRRDTRTSSPNMRSMVMGTEPKSLMVTTNGAPLHKDKRNPRERFTTVFQSDVRYHGERESRSMVVTSSNGGIANGAKCVRERVPDDEDEVGWGRKANRDTMRLALKDRPPVREFVSLLAEQAQSVERRRRKQLQAKIKQHLLEVEAIKAKAGNRRPPYLSPVMYSEKGELNNIKDSDLDKGYWDNQYDEEEDGDNDDDATSRMYRQVLRSMEQEEDFESMPLQAYHRQRQHQRHHHQHTQSHRYSHHAQYQQKRSYHQYRRHDEELYSLPVDDHCCRHQNNQNNRMLFAYESPTASPNLRHSHWSSKGSSVANFGLCRHNCRPPVRPNRHKNHARERQSLNRIWESEDTTTSSGLEAEEEDCGGGMPRRILNSPEVPNYVSEIRGRQSQFFNSLFPSRANRFGYPVYPERELGIPSASGPVSFAGFTPSLLSASASASLLSEQPGMARGEPNPPPSSLMSDQPMGGSSRLPGTRKSAKEWLMGKLLF